MRRGLLFAATAAGYRELLGWLEAFGTLELVGVEAYRPEEFKEKVDWMIDRGFLNEAPDYGEVVRSK